MANQHLCISIQEILNEFLHTTLLVYHIPKTKQSLLLMCPHELFNNQTTQKSCVRQQQKHFLIKETNLSIGVPIFSFFDLLCFGCLLQMTGHMITHRLELSNQHTIIITPFRIMIKIKCTKYLFLFCFSSLFFFHYLPDINFTSD